MKLHIVGTANRRISNPPEMMKYEIAAASDEQARGIDEVNTAVTDMDKVLQQTAGNAEESSSVSEEMSAQAA